VKNSLPLISALAASAVWTLAAPATAIAAGTDANGKDRADGRRPNVIVLLVDDWGWTDAACYGSDLYQTPNIDALNAESVRFTNGYAACTVCSPTRAALMTGMYPARLHLTDYIPGARQPDGPLRAPNWTKRLEHRYVTIADALGAAGYRTAHVGKWHLAPFSPTLAPDYAPETFGFDVNIGGNQWGQPGSYFYPYSHKDRYVGPLPPGGKEGDYLTDQLTDEATKLIRKWADQPFFIYFAYYAIHTPIEPKPELRAAYEKRLKPGLRHHNPGLAAMVQTVDESVGRLRKTLKELGIADRTVIIMAGDNGGVAPNTGATTNAPLRAGKGSVYEGGVRVPTLIYWPGVTTSGCICKEPVITMDYYPTILELTGVRGNPQHNAAVDGLSLVPLLKNPNASLPREAIYWHYPHYRPGGATPYGAVRAGPWRLVEFYEDGRAELYNLDDDIGETTDLSRQRPDEVARLRGMLHAWRTQVGAQMPTRSPNYSSHTQTKKRSG
jgi:arylsulfatase A